ncbi:MAG: hypothetical protein BYD32DRAFT_411254 [Podila humilis]|nr:MAG: hypothetical protein BYD32DRAFT_411254 [Podila humilis]
MRCMDAWMSSARLQLIPAFLGLRSLLCLVLWFGFFNLGLLGLGILDLFLGLFLGFVNVLDVPLDLWLSLDLLLGLLCLDFFLSLCLFLRFILLCLFLLLLHLLVLVVVLILLIHHRPVRRVLACHPLLLQRLARLKVHKGLTPLHLAGLYKRGHRPLVPHKRTLTAAIALHPVQVVERHADTAHLGRCRPCGAAGVVVIGQVRGAGVWEVVGHGLLDTGGAVVGVFWVEKLDGAALLLGEAGGGGGGEEGQGGGNEGDGCRDSHCVRVVGE